METTQRMQRVSGLILRRPKRTLIALVIIAALAVLAYLALGTKSPEEQAREELAAAVTAVGQLMVLPEGDEPVLATVTDAETLTKQQAFFSGAVNGDQLLLFPKNLKAVIYSPSRNKIINAGPIEQSPTTNGSAAEQSSAENQSRTIGVGVNPSADTLTVEIRNGTDKTGYAAQFAEELEANAGYTVVTVADAGRKNYQSAVVFVRTSDENKKSKIDALTTSLGVSATQSLPDGEKSTNADALIILGGE